MPDHDELHRLGFKLKFAYSIVGLIIGLVCILVGLVLGLHGVAGHTSWTASVFGLSTNLNDAAPGVVVFVVGIFMVFLTRFKIKDTVTSQVARQLEPKPENPPKSGHEGGGDNIGSSTREIIYRPAPSRDHEI